MLSIIRANTLGKDFNQLRTKPALIKGNAGWTNTTKLISNTFNAHLTYSDTKEEMEKEKNGVGKKKQGAFQQRV